MQIVVMKYMYQNGGWKKVTTNFVRELVITTFRKKQLRKLVDSVIPQCLVVRQSYLTSVLINVMDYIEQNRTLLCILVIGVQLISEYISAERNHRIIVSVLLNVLLTGEKNSGLVKTIQDLLMENIMDLVVIGLVQGNKSGTERMVTVNGAVVAKQIMEESYQFIILCQDENL